MMVSINDKKWYWNAVRGLCIVLVIFIHVTIPLDAEGVVRGEWYIFRRITAFPVALFFFMAGYFVHLDNVNSKRYLWSKIKRVLLPYFLFSTTYILLNLLLGSDANWKGILANYLLGTAELHMYYCVYLIQMIFLLPLLKYFLDSKIRNAALIGILFLSMAAAYIKVYLGVFKLLLAPICLTFLIFYVLGLYVRGYTEGRYKSATLDFFRQQKVYVVGVCTGVSLILALVEGACKYPNLQIGQISMGNYLYCVALILLFMNIYWKYGGGGCPTVLTPIVWIGEQSFSIYLCHMIVMRPMIVWFEKIGMEYPYCQIIIFFVTLLFSILFCEGKNMVMRRKECS